MCKLKNWYSWPASSQQVKVRYLTKKNYHTHFSWLWPLKISFFYSNLTNTNLLILEIFVTLSIKAQHELTFAWLELSYLNLRINLTQYHTHLFQNVSAQILFFVPKVRKGILLSVHYLLLKAHQNNVPVI